MYICVYVCIYIYIYIYSPALETSTANLCANIIDFGGFDSNIILILSGSIARPIGNFPESLSQAILVGIILVVRLGVNAVLAATDAFRRRSVAFWAEREGAPR